MIPIDRIPAPRAIETARVRHLPEVTAKAISGTKLERSDFPGYDVAKEPRWNHQKEKCACCDRDVALGSHPTEHFRPILGGYWWLAWDWDNLLFACVSCNGPKSNQFPLLTGSVHLVSPRRPPGNERPVLINPYEDDPLAIIRFRLEQGRWIPIGIDNDKRGEKTIKILGLEQNINVYTRWVEKTLWPDIKKILRLISSHPIEPVIKAKVKRKFKNFQKRFYHEYAILRSLTYSAWQHYISEIHRQQWDIDLPPPRTTAVPLTQAQTKEQQLLACLTPTARDLVYALGERAEEATWNAALLAILDIRPCLVDELSIICAATRATVLGHLARLEANQQIGLSGTGASKTAARK